MSITSGPSRPRVTVHTLAEKKQRHEPIVSLTAYDYATARLADEAGVDLILVGDSLAQVVLGYENTLPVTMEEMLHHMRAVRRGVAALVLEGIPREVAARITAEVATPTIGIGAGPDCDGQILVFHDLAGLTFHPPAKFVRRYCNAGELISQAIQSYCQEVRGGAFPSDAESYHLPREAGRMPGESDPAMAERK
jgi:ketopantoate hydroxymethyltransferase